MKHATFLLLLFVAHATNAQTKDECSTPDKLIHTFYSCLDVPKGKHIDSARFVNLFWPGAQLEGVVQSKRDTTKITNFGITPQEYLRSMKGFTATHRFKEWETGRQTLSFGHMLTIYSGYELVDLTPKGDTIHLYGVNVLQLFYDQERWWITYCTYEEQSPEFPVPSVLRSPAKKE